MTCRDVDRLLASHGSAALSAARNHAAICPRCGELLRAIAVEDGGAESLRPGLANQISSRLAGDLKPVHPLPSPIYFAAAFVLIPIALALMGGLLLGDYAWLRMNPLTSLLTFTSLAVSLCLLASALSAQMIPGSRHLLPPLALALGILCGLATVFSALFSSIPERAFWLDAWRCLRSGLAAGCLSALLLWFVLRRGAVLDTRTCGALAGLLGGLTGTAMLEIHCPNFNLAHILAGHWAAAVLGAGIGWIAGGIVARRG